MTAVRATARLQLHRRFTFADAAAQVEYFAALGVSHLYLSPIARARPGSMHGYDVVDPTAVSRQLGGERGLLALAAALRAHGMGLVVDIVPNHMAADWRNRWWDDVLRRGERSRFAAFFDIDWRPPERVLRGKLLLPILGEALAPTAAAHGFRLGARADGEFRLHYGDHDLPLSAASHALLLHLAHEPALEAVAADYAAAASSHGIEAFAAAGSRLADVLRAPASRRALQALLRDCSSDARRMCDLLDAQNYRLVPWREAPRHINWRRFFDINELVALRVEHPPVFDAVHALPLRLYAEGVVDGLRIDHVDGLYNPRAYCQQLRSRLDDARARRPAGLADEPAYLVVEKILGPGELLPGDWPVQGTTGYDFMDMVGGWQHDGRGRQALDRAWQAVAPDLACHDSLVRECRALVVDDRFRADLRRACGALRKALDREPDHERAPAAATRAVLRALLVHFPVYRSYLEPGRPVSPADRAAWAAAFAGLQSQPALDASAARVARCLRGWINDWPESARGADGASRAAAIMRLQQLLPPVAAKAVEDTAGYRYLRLLSRCEVGSDAGQLAHDDQALRGFLAQRARNAPHSLSATATHDHKRGEDVRARLAVLSEMAEDWAALCARWRAALAPLRQACGGAPEPADEYALWQTLVGVWPPGLRFDDAVAVERLRRRVEAWQRKALREAGLRSSWLQPAQRYEEQCREYLRGLLEAGAQPAFQQPFLELLARITPAGVINGWSQTLLRIAAPGIPDLYQGNALEDSSMVDPDNRRAVDYPRRAAALGVSPDLRRLLAHWPDGMLKQHITRALLQARTRWPQAFAGECTPLHVAGAHAAHVFAFARGDGARRAVAIVLHHPLALLGGAPAPRLPRETWQRTELALGGAAERQYLEVLSGRSLRAGGSLALAEALVELPLALLVSADGAGG
ncbi:MAG TPA: malto-oligosyltrehalose synthase [Rhodanobacteraceae bacterium]|nr:malto-oligosyltrehalose synthase [Rhodanobacteraceae bacterium]